MSYRFVLGGSGSGKSTGLYQFIIDESIKNPGKQYIIIVPDQYTLAVQKQVTNMHPGKCILNIDVLSFSRLGHRIFSETGEDKTPILDDTGKNLILSQVTAKLESQLNVLEGKIHKPSVIEQLKSLISEFMQYGIGDKEIDSLIELAEKNMRSALADKLRDVKLIYQEFLATIAGKYDTRESRYGKLSRMMEKSELLKGAVVVFDGFTGFTPVQHCVLETMISRAETVYFSFLWDSRQGADEKVSEYDLFSLSSKAMDNIRKIGDRAGKKELPAKIIDTANKRFAGNPALAALEKNLFRSGRDRLNKASCQGRVQIFTSANPYEEVKLAAAFIKKITTEDGFAYRDVAICCGSLDEYIEPIRRVFAENDIPGYIDVKKKVKDNPLVEYINGMLRLEDRRYSYESVFTCVKNIFSGIDDASCDRLENYCLANGIKGRQRWKSSYFGYSYKNEEVTEELNRIDSIRELFADRIPDFPGSDASMRDYCELVRNILERSNIEDSMEQIAEHFAATDQARAQEYSKVYDYILQCLDQIEEFVPDDSTDAARFLEVFNAAISELTVGTIPQNVDRILVGDMERTRFSHIKVMMVLGVNDGSIPKKGDRSGILTVNDRQLFEGEIELSPGPRELMYRQRLYLYMNLTQASDLLYMSYSAASSTGAEKQPSYLIDQVKSLYDDLTEQAGKDFFEKYVYTQGMLYEKSAGFLREAVSRHLIFETGLDEQYEAYINAYLYLRKKNPELAEHMSQAAFYMYNHNALGRELAESLYGTRLSGNISAFQEFYKCPYMYFLKFGIKLQEREKFEFDFNDTGNMIHKLLETMGDRFEKLGVNWEDASDDEIDSMLEDILVDIIKPSYKYKLEYSGKNRFGLRTAARVAARSVRVLSYHLKQGDFKPVSFEKKFTDYIDLEDEHSLTFKGSIDRVDVARTDEEDYFKVIDYKTGSAEPELADLYNGLNLQLPVYMDEVLRANEGISKKKSIPAAMLVYAARDPLLDPEGSITDEKLENSRLDKLKSKGYINSDPEVIKLLDRGSDGSESEIVKLKGSKLKASGESQHTQNGSYSEEDLRKIMAFARQKIVDAGNEIYKGNICVSPYIKGKGRNAKSGCDYCSFSKICGMGSGLPGLEYRELDRDAEKIFE